MAPSRTSTSSARHSDARRVSRCIQRSPAGYGRGRADEAFPKLEVPGIPPIHDEAVDGWGTPSSIGVPRESKKCGGGLFWRRASLLAWREDSLDRCRNRSIWVTFHANWASKTQQRPLHKSRFSRATRPEFSDARNPTNLTVLVGLCRKLGTTDPWLLQCSRGPSQPSSAVELANLAAHVRPG
jgi:hypothetical protein